jgi:hypothetical protein
MGIIFYEMWVPLGSYMERAEHLNLLKSGVMLEEVKKKIPEGVAKLILNLVSIDPNDRPSIQELL